ncbi:MAG: dipeptidyl aminopeptidase/acylaminoacyl peptidase [Gammaproteobacteria bacterium]|jgi:dipeptidyl aminopeptidase/acylaminoacyl peptidase
MNRALVTAIVIVGLFTGSSGVAEESDPYPLEYWALRSVIDRAQISPDGKYIGVMKIASKDGNPVIEIYETNNLAKEPFRLNADPMEITNFYWASDEDIVFTLRQKVRDRIDGFNRGVYENRIATVSVKKRKIRAFDELGPSIENLLPNKPNKVILSFFEGGEDGPGSKLDAAFRPQSYWEFNLDTGAKKLLIRGKLSLGNISFDGDGNPWLARGFDRAKREYIYYVRPPGEKGWVEAHRQSEDIPDTFWVHGPDPTSPDHLLVRAHNGADKTGLWSYNYRTRTFDELIYQRSDVDIVGVRRHSNDWQHPDDIVGVAYYKDKYHFEYFDDAEAAKYNLLEASIPNASHITIPSSSRDGKSMIVFNDGPRDPGTYYLLANGKLESIGSRQPLLESEKLADVRYVTYKARDGLSIPGFVTVPNSEPPYPLIVLPHGGPFVQETVIFDEWAQMLANNGYMVLQPQYRGSQGYGLDFYTSAFMLDGGQGGYKMQDDKDDGALYLVEQGLVDPDRMAMFGWSYGGYAALIAASRTPQIYQCVIAGAAVTDTNMQVNYYRFAMSGASRDEQLRMWDDSIAPIDEDEVAKINIPMLLVHGSVDQRVPPVHVRKYMKMLDKNNKSYKYLELEGADHFSSTLFYNHQIDLYESMTDYLQNDCGPDGL